MRLVVGNFKMNLNNDEIINYINYFKGKDLNNVVFAPPSIYLKDFVNNGFTTCSQDVSFASKGAYTGDISAQQLKSIGIKYSIIGHSERRKYYGDSSLVNEKLQRLLEEDIIPIICIGETKEERDNNETFKCLAEEIDTVFKNIDTNCLNNVIIAYEPIWSIGTGVIPTNKEILETISYIKNYIKDNYKLTLSCLYGGSVNNNCIETLENIEVVDGYLVGGCSIKKEDFDKLINNIK